MRVTWDVFCRVIDNFGDIGVTWRLAKQLNQEHGFAVRLWVDHLAVFHQICPAVSSTADQQEVDGVEVYHWHDKTVAAQTSCADVVIEAFACQLPEHYLGLMQRKQAVLWLNFEYLTAEPWAAEYHALPSLQNGGLHKYFFFPGFTENTGGLLREAGLLKQRDEFLSSVHRRKTYLDSLAVQQQSGERLISLFAYANQALPSLLEALSKDTQRNRLLVLQGPLQSSIAHWFSVHELQAGREYQKNSLIVQVLPYIEQKQLDKLLWCCDLNCVRGEDSFVRAQWAGKPILWHIYPQEDDAHLVKLDAFFALYSDALDDDSAIALNSLWQAWNQQAVMSHAWQLFVEREQLLQSHARRWSALQNKQTDLATKLAHFYQNWL
ncbi:MAG TPA: elongation factor P maturation arginine rhamnosyltransferase EarP [Gammaproteobacteria bacterium]|nr:elongation factor P maturation arginine rhamnosyltransferase EarP [Gammaproteobacteria bacterium]